MIVDFDKSCLLIGNTRWHWAYEIDDLWHFSHEPPDLNKLKFLGDSVVAWASVGRTPKGKFLRPEHRIELNHVPLKSMPPWLGIDRALGAWAACKKARELQEISSGLLVADAGTILSLTRVTSNGEFSGGQLVAGLQLQLFAMSQGAQNLRDVSLENFPQEPFPVATKDAMKKGAIQALVGILLEAQRVAASPLWICGGDAPFILDELQIAEIGVRHCPNLVLEGMVDVYKNVNLEKDR